MGYKESFASLKSGAQADVEKATKVVTEIESAETDVEAMLAKAASDKEVARQEGHEAGFEEGLKQAGQAGGSDKLYSDAEMNAERELVKETTAKPLNEKIDALSKENDDLKSKISDMEAASTKSEAEMNAAVEAARAELKAQFVSDIKAVDVDNQAMLKKYEEVPKAPSEEATDVQPTLPKQAE